MVIGVIKVEEEEEEVAMGIKEVDMEVIKVMETQEELIMEIKVHGKVILIRIV